MPIDRTRKSASKTLVASTGNGSKPPAPNGSRARKRVKQLFSDIERIAKETSVDCEERIADQLGDGFGEHKTLVPPALSDDAKVQRELEALRARVQELELQLQQNNRLTLAPFLYEKEQVGYTFKGNTIVPLSFSIDGQEVEAKNALKAPLTATGQVIGSVCVEPSPEREWATDEESLLNTVAQQTSLQIQSLRLLASAERARTEAEEATRRYMHESWASYMDAIHQHERVGYSYDQASVTPFLDDPSEADGFREKVQVMDEQVGVLSLKPDPARPLTESDQKLVAAVANQVAQQVENIRLLADASRARAEAENATRRMMRESWKSYVSQRGEEAFGYFYDTVQVRPLEKSSALQDRMFTLPLEVRGEAIGQLAIASEEGLSLDTLELAKAIAAQTSTHLETLRLSEQNEKRAHELETVAEVGVTTSTTLDPDMLLQAVVDRTKERFGLYHAHIYIIDDAGETLQLRAGAGDVGRKLVADNWRIPLDHPTSIVVKAAQYRKYIIANDINRSKNTAFLSNNLLPDTHSEMAVPMIVGDKLLGVFDVQSETANYFSEEDAHIYTTLTAQVAVALQNARLYAEQAATVSQLQELDRLKSGFLANMSHELRTPLNSILGFADVILMELDGPLTDNMNTDLKLIQKNGQHLLHLINDVLDMAKIESGRMNLNPEKFRLHDMLEEVNSITSALASERNISLLIEPDSDQEVEVYADNTRLRQVMINLVNNAIKFTENGKITIRATRQDSATVMITVKDTGIGIPPEKLEDIFQEFTQVDTSTTRKVGGTGLGLPISRRLIQMHGGRLWAESTGVAGDGSTFFVELPLEARITEVVEKRER